MNYLMIELMIGGDHELSNQRINESLQKRGGLKSVPPFFYVRPLTKSVFEKQDETFARVFKFSRFTELLRVMP